MQSLTAMPQGARKMTNSEIKAYSLDGFKDGFEAAINKVAEMLDKKYKADFLKDMAEI